MAISDAKAVFGLSAVGTGTRPWISQSATIGLTQTGVPLPDATIAFSAELYLQGGDSATLDLSDFSTTIDAAAAVQSTSTLTLTGNAVAAETVTVGDIVYTWRASVSTTANEVKIGATASDSLDNLIAAINAGAGGGTVYGSATVANPKATAAAGTGDTMIASAVAVGELGNGVVTTETMTNGSWNRAAMAGGLNANSWDGANVDFQGTAITPPNQIKAILVYVEKGTSNSTMEFDASSTIIPIFEGLRFQIASPSTESLDGLVNLDNVIFTAGSETLKLKIAVIAN